MENRIILKTKNVKFLVLMQTLNKGKSQLVIKKIRE